MTSPSSPFVVAGPKPVRSDSAFGRFYQVEGQPEPFPSVTHVLSCLGKPALINWAASEERKLVLEAAADLYVDTARLPQPMMRTAYVESLLTRLTKVKAHQKQLAKAGEVGTQLHNMAEWFLRKQAGQVVGPEPPLSAEAAVSFQHFQTWVADIKLQPAFLEQTVWSTKYRYAGTLDVFGRLGKHQVVIDFKTSSALYAEYDLQVAAYVQAIREMKQGTPTHGFLVRFPKKATDTFEVREIPDWRARFKEFLKVRQMFDVWYAWERAYQEKRQAAKDAAKAAPVAPATNDGVEATF